MLKACIVASLLLSVGCNSGTGAADTESEDPIIIITTDDETKKGAGATPTHNDAGNQKDQLDMDNSVPSDSGSTIGKMDMNTTPKVDMKPTPEGEVMQFVDVLANCSLQATPTPNCAPAPPPSRGNPSIDCVNRINQFRAHCQCLPPLKRWTDGEQCANDQAQYDSDRNQPHAAFSAGICQGGSGQNECPRYGSQDQVIGTCLQQMWNEGPGTPFSAHGHYLNMTNPRFSQVACGSYEGNNRVWAIQNFR